jgi:hypothetical protein
MLWTGNTPFAMGLQGGIWNTRYSKKEISSYSRAYESKIQSDPGGVPFSTAPS